MRRSLRRTFFRPEPVPGFSNIRSQPLQFQKTDVNGINNTVLQLIDRHQSTSFCRTNQELRLPAYGVSQKNNDIGQAYFFSPLPLPPFLLSPSHQPSGLIFVLSPIFHCHKIKDGGYNNITNTKKVSLTQNTPALQANQMEPPSPIQALGVNLSRVDL